MVKIKPQQTETEYVFEVGDRIWGKEAPNVDWREYEVLAVDEIETDSNHRYPEPGMLQVKRIENGYEFGINAELCRPATAMRYYPKRLIIVACSATKTKAKRGSTQDIYDGVIHKVIRKALRENYFPCRSDVVVLSAKYGLIRRCDWIENYELRMTPGRARELRPQVEYALSSIAAIGYNESRDLVSFHSLLPTPYSPLPTPSQRDPYVEIYVELGKDYLGAIADLLPKYFPDVPIHYGKGGIGERQAQLVAWLKDRSQRKISVGNRIKVTGTWAGAVGEVVAEDHFSGKLFVELEGRDGRLDYWEDQLELLDARISYRTPGTRQVWRDLKEWFHVAYYHFEAKPDGTHRANPDRIGAEWHVKELLKTNLIEECSDRPLVEECYGFFNSKQRNNSSFRLPSREHRNDSPNGELCNRLHNQLARLKSDKPLARTVSKQEIAEAKQRFIVDARVYGPDLQGEWKHGIVLQTHKKGTQIVVRFDDGSFTQYGITKFLQLGFTESDEPLPLVERFLFKKGDRVISKRYRDAIPATVLQEMPDHQVKIQFDNGKTTVCDESELTFYFESGHPYPELYLLWLEQELKRLIAIDDPENDYLERQQETVLAKAQQFALANELEIDGSEDRWVIHPDGLQNVKHICPEFELGQLARQLPERLAGPDDEREDWLDQIDEISIECSVEEQGSEDDLYFTGDRPYCNLPPFCSIELLTLGNQDEEQYPVELAIGDRVAEGQYSDLERYGTVVEIRDGVPLVQWTHGITQGFVTVAPPTVRRLSFAFKVGDRVRVNGITFQNSRAHYNRRFIVTEVGVGHELSPRPIRYKVQFLDQDDKPFGALWYLEEDLAPINTGELRESNSCRGELRASLDRPNEDCVHQAVEPNSRSSSRAIGSDRPPSSDGGSKYSVILEPVQRISESKRKKRNNRPVVHEAVQLSLFGGQ